MLFEAVTGDLPFAIDTPSELFSRWERPAPRAKDLVEAVPDDIDHLIGLLLDPDPERRPGAAQVQRLVSRSAGARPVEPVPDRVQPPFVGRSQQLVELRSALAESRERPVLVDIRGASGIGKTTLIRRFLDETAGEPVTELRSRCHPRETIPFKAIDGLVDDLTRVLNHEGGETARTVLPRHHTSLLTTFPVMGRVPAFSSAAATQPPRERGEVRRQAFEALREVVARLADRRPVVLWIDDAQWGDTDSAVALTHLLRPPDPPRVLVIVSRRGGSFDASHASDRFDLVVPGVAYRRIELAPLTHEEITELIRAECSSERTVDPYRVRQLAQEAAGNPFLAIELARSSGADPSIGTRALPLLASLVARRMASLAAPARDLLVLLAVAGRPLDSSILPEPRGRLQHSWELSEQKLVTLLPRGSGMVISLQHDALRDAVLATLEPQRVRELHRELASILESSPAHDGEDLVEHWIAAGMHDRAATAAVRIGDAALAAGAFRRAADSYARAIDLGTSHLPRWLLLAKLASVQADDGRLSDAADSWEHAAQELAREDRDDLEQGMLLARAVSAHLHAGRLAKGFEALKRAGRITGIAFPTSRIDAMFQIVRTNIGETIQTRLPNTRARSSTHEPLLRTQVELCWEAARSLRFIDMMRSAAYGSKHRVLAHRLGDAGHISRALGVSALMRAMAKADRGWGRTDAMLIEAERMAESTRDAHAIAHAALMRATALAVNTRWSEALSASEDGERYWRAECRGAGWELATFHQNILLSLSMLGKLDEVRVRMLQYLDDARDRGDEFAASVLPIGIQNLAWLGADDPDEAERRVDMAVGRSFEHDNSWLLYNVGHARGHIALYRGDGIEAHSYVARISRLLRRRGLLRVPSIRVNYADLRARCALLAAEQSPDASAREQWLRVASAELRLIRRADVSWAEPFADRIQGAVDGLRGNLEQARRFLERAVLGMQHQGLGLLAAGTRYRLSRLMPGNSGDAMRSEAVRWMHDHGTSNPARMLHLC